ncbi:MAG: hypothetical protein ACJ77K_15560 [Bacteroidia bacterium]
MLVIYSAERLRFVIGSEKITATFAMNVNAEKNNEQIIYPIVEYTRKSRYNGADTVYQFAGTADTKYDEGETVPVLLIGKDPNFPMLYSFGSFWLFPLVYYILPLLLWSAFCFSFIGKKETVLVSFRPPFFSKMK